MGIRFLPMTKEDYEQRCRVLVREEQLWQDPSEAEEISGDFRTIRVNTRDYHLRYYLKLVRPCFNFAAGGTNFSMVRKLLGISSKEMARIISFQAALTHQGQLVAIEAADQTYENCQNLLIGPEIIIFYLQQFNLEERLLTALWEDCVVPALRPYIAKGLLRKGRIHREKAGGILICGGYYYHNPAVVNLPAMEDKLITYMGEAVFQKRLSAVSLLLRLSDLKAAEPHVYESILAGFCPERISVLPFAMRPSLKGHGVHKLTKAYMHIFHCNENMAGIRKSEVTPGQYAELYSTLCDALKILQKTNIYKDREYGDLKQMNSILEDLKGKNGDIREGMFRKRQDYSGRTAVVVDPFLSLKKIRIPEEMLVKLLRHHIAGLRKTDKRGKQVPVVPAAILARRNSPRDVDYFMAIIREYQLLDKIPFFLGRNPTLHKHGIQGFYAEPTKGKAIEVNPLVCPAFNMDFDGDTAHVGVPLSPAAIAEVKNLMAATRNLRLPKDGESTISPRQDMIYGLYMCTRREYEPGPVAAVFANLLAVRQGLYSQKIAVWDTVAAGDYQDLAGKLAVLSCFPPGMYQEVREIEEINNKTIKRYVDELLKGSNEEFVRTIDQLVELGFKIAYLYSPPISLLAPAKAGAAARQPLKLPQETEMAEILDLNDLGFYSPESFALAYNQCFHKVEQYYQDKVSKGETKNDGYYLMAKSGARGNQSNLMQIFGYKGRIMKSATESFHTVIRNSFESQLSPLEHFIAAYGGRKGQIDKSIKTADTGYLSRQMWHTTAPLMITCEDCRTDEGVVIRKKDLALYVKGRGKDSDVDKKVRELFAGIITGRFTAKTNTYINQQLAGQLAAGQCEEVVIRSPVKCQNPCCIKCYGVDPGTGRLAVIGTPVGFHGAHAIGEPNTQLTMKQFQNGGIATGRVIMSDFERTEKYLDYGRMDEAARQGNYPLYDPVAWADGYIKEQVLDSFFKEVTISATDPEGRPHPGRVQADGTIKKAGAGKKCRLPVEAILKTGKDGQGNYIPIHKGESMSLNKGDYYIEEIRKYRGFEEGIIHLLLSLFMIYEKECQVDFKHFETMVACMVGNLIIDTDHKELMIGQVYTNIELAKIAKQKGYPTKSAFLQNTCLYPRLYGLKTLPKRCAEGLSGLLFEDQGEALASNLVKAQTDSMTAPLQRLAFGLKPYVGTGYAENYINEMALHNQ